MTLAVATDQRHLKRGVGAGLPDDFDLGPPGILFDRHDHLADQGPQKLLAVPRGRGVRPPEAGRVVCEPRERVALGGCERLGLSAFEFGELSPLALQP